MHVPDGYLDAPTSVGTAAVAAVGVALALRAARSELPGDRAVPLAGLVATFVFAAQMINVPVGDGTSGHLLGGALAAVLVGPATAVLVISTVLLVQGLLFADGGLTALGTNITLMALVGALVGWAVFRVALTVLPARSTSVTPAAVVGALVSVPVAAVAFTALFAVGGRAPVELGDVLAAMIGWHALIGVGEAVVTGLVVTTVATTRPDLVHGLRYVRRGAQVEVAA